MRIIYGLFILFIFVALGQLLNMVLLNWILKSIMAMLVVAIPVVFQPELRTALEKLGRTKLLGELAFSRSEDQYIVDEIIQAVDFFVTRKIGALIVIRRQTGLKEYMDSGVRIDSKISAKLLETIFFPRSPLHDGAVIIANDKIVSAGSILPVSTANVGSGYGTRHKAGLGITEISDALAIVVSEETSRVSFAVGGKLESRIPLDKLKNRLLYYLKYEKKGK